MVNDLIIQSKDMFNIFPF